MLEEAGQSAVVSLTALSHVAGKAQLLNTQACAVSQTGKTIIMGPNGAGKSLLLRIMAGLIVPTSGKRHMTEQIRTSFVFQKPVLLRRSVRANIAYVLNAIDVPSAEQAERVMVSLRQAGLEHRADTPARQLSGGEQQRLCLSRALAVEPGIVFLDEPTASLDPASTSAVEEMIERAGHDGVKVVLVTHDIKQAKRLADDVIFMHKGEILVHKPADEFFANPGHPAAQGYLDGELVF